MRRLGAVFLVFALWLVLPAACASADGMVLPMPDALKPQYLAVRTHHVRVEIADGLAVTRVEQEFYNPHEYPVAGRYLFPIPPDAVLSGFEVLVDGHQQDVRRQGATETNTALYAAVTQQGDPSLLQYADWDSLALDLNMAPASSRKMTLQYQEMLAPQGGLYRYHYVLSTERYSSSPLEQVSVTVDLRSSTGMASLYSASHPVVTESLRDGGIRVRWEAKGVNPTQDFELFFAQAGDGFGGGFITGERRGQDHFLFLFSPQVGRGQVPRLPKDIVFVLDRSGSMAGEKIEQVRLALQHILGQLQKGDRFALLAFNDRISALSYTLQPVDEHALQDAERFVNALSAENGTDLELALRTALEILVGAGERGAARQVLFLSDGLPTSGLTDEVEIADALLRSNDAAGARLHAFGVGYDVNTHLLDRLVTASSGTVTYVRPDENVETALTEFYGEVSDPVLTDLEVEFYGLEVSDLYPQLLPDLYRGSGLLLAGRYQSSTEPVLVRIHGWSGEHYHEYIYHFQVAGLQNHDFVPRLWATRRVGALLDQLRTEGWRQALEDEIRALGLDYGIVTPYTEFVIEHQTAGAASADNMRLYRAAELNQASGRVTVEARMQNQEYQQATQASLAQGANLVNYGRHSLAQIGTQQVDLSLLQGREGWHEPITAEWMARNLHPDRTIRFGSEEYFALASDPEARPYLQSGREVIFSHKGEVIAVRDRGPEGVSTDDPQASAAVSLTAHRAVLNRTDFVANWMAREWVVRGLAFLAALWAQ
jgi:Ca-activated chloride channel family protein